MPIYEFRCACGIQFEKLFSRIVETPTHPCPDCGKAAPKLVSASNFSFSHTPVGGPRPQNTGVYSIDYNADRVIGRDAAARWKTIEERQGHKRKVMAEHGVSGHDLTRTSNAESPYRVMESQERQAAETARSLHKEALTRIESAKKSQ